jgi:hypothetical protein
MNGGGGGGHTRGLLRNGFSFFSFGEERKAQEKLPLVPTLSPLLLLLLLLLLKSLTSSLPEKMGLLTSNDIR